MARCINNQLISDFTEQDEVDYMRKVTILVFEILEKAWALRDCALIDMKIEFGVDSDGMVPYSIIDYSFFLKQVLKLTFFKVIYFWLTSLTPTLGGYGHLAIRG